MINEFAISESRSCTRCQPERAVVDSSDETAADENSSGGSAIEEVVGAEG